MRIVGFVLMLFAVVLVAAGMITGCNATLNHNGRHEVATYPIEMGKPLRVSFDAKSERRYTAGIQLVFGGDGPVEAKVPFVSSISDGSAKIDNAGFIDPSVPPTTLVHRERRAERLIGPYPAPSDRKVDLVVTLTDDPKATEITEMKVVLYDDAKSASLARGFGTAGVGVLLFIGGGVLVVTGGRRRKRDRK